jgi:glycogenin
MTEIPADPQAYVTVLSTDSYAVGSYALLRSLQRAGVGHPLYVFLSPAVSEAIARALAAAGARVERLEAGLDLGQDVVRKNSSAGFVRWNATFDKLQVFSMTRFEKIVFLDSDMLVLSNLDALFAAPHLSAVIAGGSVKSRDWHHLNSGLMVIEPAAGLTDTILSAWIADGGPDRPVGDQDIIQHHAFDWPERRELHLDEGYNMFADDLADYRHLGFGPTGRRRIHVLHFVGERKPWRLPPRRALRQTLRTFRFGGLSAGIGFLHYLSDCRRFAGLVR